MSKLLLALQIWPGDANRTLALTRLICDIETKRRNDVIFGLFHTREVTQEYTKEWAAITVEKFQTLILRSNRFGRGWPLGPGDLWQDCMLQMADRVIQGQSDVDGVLTFEPDCIPLRTDWIDCLKSEWEKAREKGYQVCGHIHGEGEGKHINGNAIFSATMIRDHPKTCSSATSWDMEHRALFLEIGIDTNLITQFYADKTLYTPEQLAKIRKNGEIPALLHGLKDSKNIDSARELLLPSERLEAISEMP